MKHNYHVVLKKGGGGSFYFFESQIPPEFSEKVLLLGETKAFGMLNGMVVHVEPNQSYILVPSGDYEDNIYSDGYFTLSTWSKPKYVAFRPAYVNPSPFGNSLSDHPNGANNPLREDGMRVMFHEEMSLHDRWWAWDARGNTLQNNFEWSSGKNCVF